MPDGLSIKVDTAEFDRVFKEYMTYTSRDLAEAVNQHAYYIARNAVNVTKGVGKDRIRHELEAGADDYPDVPLAAIIVQKRRKAKSLSGLSGPKMATEVERLIRARQAARNFIKAGWIPAVKYLETLVPRKRGKSLSGVKKRGVDKGGAKGASKSLLNWNPIATLWNSVSKLKPEGIREMEKGAKLAIADEAQSMRDYILMKQNQRCKTFWGS